MRFTVWLIVRMFNRRVGNLPAGDSVLKSSCLIFLAYHREDQAPAKLFAEAFEAQVFKVWWDVGL